MPQFVIPRLASQLQRRTAEYMLDTCTVLWYADGTANEYNEQDAPTYTPTYTGACGLNMQPGSERQGDNTTTIQYDALLHLPFGTQIKETDRVEITSRHGQHPDGLTFEVVSPILRGITDFRVLLRKIVT